MPPSPGFATRPEIEEAEKGFVAWLEANGAALCGVRITRFADGSGRGVAAARNLDAGEVVVKVPESLVLTPESSRAADAFREFGLGPEEFDSGRLEREALVLAILAEQASGTRSRWWEYLTALPPPQHLHCPVLWNDQELEMLKGTSLFKNLMEPDDDTQELPNMTQEHWQHVAVPFLEANSRLGFGTTEAGRQAHSYATALVASYSFSLGKDRVQAMVPFWDMLNHASPGGEGVRLHYDQDSKSMQMITTKPHKEGQQVFNTYGPIGNSELLRRYGFTMDANPHDSAQLRIDNDRLVAMALDNMTEHSGEGYHIMHALNLMAEAKILSSCSIVADIPSSGWPPAELLEALRLLTMDRGQLDLLSRSLRARGSRRRYKPIERLRKIFAVDDRQAREMGEMITRLAQDALQAWKASNAGREEQSLRKGVRKERCALAKAAADAERLCMESLLTFAAEMDAKWIAENLGSCRVWHILASKRRRRLPDFDFSPYHKYAHTLASAGR